MIGRPARNDNDIPSWWQIAGLAALGPILLALMALWLGGEYRFSAQNRDLLSQSYEQRRDIDQLLSLVEQAETGQRGYLLSGDREFLAPYTEAKAALPTHLDRVAKASSGSEEARRDFATLDALIQAKFGEMQMLIDLRDRRGAEAAASRLSQGNGKRMMDSIRASLGRMETDRTAAVAERRQAETERIATNQLMIWVAIAFVALAACVFGYLLGHGRRLRAQLARDNAEAAARLQAIFDSTTDAIILINPSGSIEAINPAAERIFGYRTSELLRRDIATLIDIAPGEGPFLKRVGYANGRLQRQEIIGADGRSRDGAGVPVDITLGVMPLPDGIHIVAALRDAATRREVERLKDDFISTVSHELRTPLTSVVGSLGLLRSGAAGELPVSAQRLAEIAETNSQRLIRLINDILDIDQMQKGRMSFDYAVIDLRDVMTKSLQAMEGLAGRKWTRIDMRIPDEPAMACADIDRLLQVANNLLSNAIKFSPERSHILFELFDGPDAHVIQVTDNGPGIDPEFSKQIFNRFSQASRPGAQMIAGTGLGLAISREIVRHHGGDISFESRKEGGARFAFSIPRDGLTDDKALAGSVRVLICEDDHDAGSTIRSILDAHGYASDLVTTVRDAIDYARTRHYDAVLLDLTLADADGAEVMRALKATQETRYLPVIVISGATPKPTQADGEDSEFADWVRKPFDPSRLIQAIQRTLRRVDRHRPMILHIDDDQDTRDLFSAALAGRGQIMAANSVAAAQAMIADHHPDIVVLDLGLPDGNGAALIPKLRDADGNGMSIVIYSAQEVDAETRRRADAVLVKSRQSLPKLVSTVMRIVESKNGSKP